ncbi:Synapse-associated protein 1 [Borealophlyctis nickersoniae]|nr:Synapse-associated protein 1 [Borealophlyctis nickersoniae]
MFSSSFASLASYATKLKTKLDEAAASLDAQHAAALKAQKERDGDFKEPPEELGVKVIPGVAPAAGLTIPPLPPLPPALAKGLGGLTGAISNVVPAALAEKLKVFDSPDAANKAAEAGGGSGKVGDGHVDAPNNATAKGASAPVGDQVFEPWAGCDNVEELKQQIVALSEDKRHFLMDPPEGTDFTFDMNAYYSSAMVRFSSYRRFWYELPISRQPQKAVLKVDEKLQKLRYELVPKSIKEPIFWRNYFYRVHLLKHHHQNAFSLANAEKKAGLVAAGQSDVPENPTRSGTSTPPVSRSTNASPPPPPSTLSSSAGVTARELRAVVGLPTSDEAGLEPSPTLDDEEFASDVYGSDWEKELQEELDEVEDEDGEGGLDL